MTVLGRVEVMTRFMGYTRVVVGVGVHGVVILPSTIYLVYFNDHQLVKTGCCRCVKYTELDDDRGWNTVKILI